MGKVARGKKGNGLKGGKKKGSSGKKARAKAKLDRQWGEHVTEDDLKKQNNKTRKGKSRLTNYSRINNTNANNKQSFMQTQHDDNSIAIEDQTDNLHSIHSSSDTDSSHHDDDDQSMNNMSSDDEQDNHPLNSLLNRIKPSTHKNNKRQKYSQDAINSVSDSDTDQTDQDSDSDQTSVSSTPENNMDDDEAPHSNQIDQIQVTGNTDAFAHFFGQDPLPEGESNSQDNLLTRRGKLQRITTSSILHPSLDFFQSSGQKGTITSLTNDADNNSDKDIRKHLFLQKCQSLAHFYSSQLGPTLMQSWNNINQSYVRSNADSATTARNIYKTNTKNNANILYSNLQATILPSLLNYSDIQLPILTKQNRPAIQNITILHILHHVLTSRSRIQRHNLALHKENQKKDNNDANPSTDNHNDTINNDEDKFRDQGYTRPKVLCLLPTRGICHSFVQQLLKLLGSDIITKTSTNNEKNNNLMVDNLDRFTAEFGPPEEVAEADDDEMAKHRKSVLKAKGAEWQELFGDDVNTDDEFKIGIAISPNASSNPFEKLGDKKKHKMKKKKNGTYVKLYSDFYKSDIIISSPLGLKMAMSTKNNYDYDDDNDNNHKKKRNSKNKNKDYDDEDDYEDVDFLSSIEICVVDHCDVLLMQNWDHVDSALGSLNHQPKRINNDTDFSRVRNYLLAGQAAHWRQLIMLSRFNDPSFLSCFKRYSKSIAGQLKVRRRVSSENASISNVLLVKLRQVFQRMPCSSLASQGNDRLTYFSKKVLPQLLQLQQKHTLIYIPSYFDFVGIRNILLKKDQTSHDFVSVTEYARVSEVSRGRARFLQGRKSIMLYTGRAHYFLRHKIKGVKHIIIFGLPEHAEFYPLVVNMLCDGAIENDDMGSTDTSPASCLTLFTKYEAHALERIVGTSHCERMTKGTKANFLFCS